MISEVLYIKLVQASSYHLWGWSSTIDYFLSSSSSIPDRNGPEYMLVLLYLIVLLNLKLVKWIDFVYLATHRWQAPWSKMPRTCWRYVSASKSRTKCQWEFAHFCGATARMHPVNPGGSATGSPYRNRTVYDASNQLCKQKVWSESKRTSFTEISAATKKPTVKATLKLRW